MERCREKCEMVEKKKYNYADPAARGLVRREPRGPTKMRRNLQVNLVDGGVVALLVGRLVGGRRGREARVDAPHVAPAPAVERRDGLQRVPCGGERECAYARARA